MNTPSSLSPYLQQSLKESNILDFHITPSDSTRWVVSRFTEGGKEAIGNVYVEFDGENFRYISTNLKGKEIFQPTTDFNQVEMLFERYAKLLELQQVRKNQNKIITYNINLKNSNTMKNQEQNTTQKTQKQNQLRFIEYEKPIADGHFITVGDSYHNTIGRIHKSYNEEIKKYEYIAFDHAGNLLSKGDKLWEIKNEFIKNREQFLEQAHQRRIEAKGKTKVELKEKQQNKVIGRNAEMENLREEKIGKAKEISNEKVDDNSGTDTKTRRTSEDENETYSHEEERSQELDDLRNDKDDDRGEMDMER
jgi:hypothetical protein